MSEYNLKEAVQEVKLVNITPKPIETVYKAYKICYAKGNYDDIKIPQRTTIENGEEINVPDYIKMINFIIKPMSADPPHTSPLEHVSFTFSFSGVSRALTHQLVRHRTGKFNQQSQRYVDFSSFQFVLPPRFKNSPLAKDLFLKTMEQDAENYDKLLEIGIADEIINSMTKEQKQEVQSELSNYLMDTTKGIVQAYKKLYPKEYNKIKKLVQEDARYVLSNACTSNIIMTMDLNNFRKFYALRNCTNAQWEIRELAKKCGELLIKHVPFALYRVMPCGETCMGCKRGLSIAKKRKENEGGK